MAFEKIILRLSIQSCPLGTVHKRQEIPCAPVGEQGRQTFPVFPQIKFRIATGTEKRAPPSKTSKADLMGGLKHHGRVAVSAAGPRDDPRSGMVYGGFFSNRTQGTAGVASALATKTKTNPPIRRKTEPSNVSSSTNGTFWIKPPGRGGMGKVETSWVASSARGIETTGEFRSSFRRSLFPCRVRGGGEPPLGRIFHVVFTAFDGQILVVRFPDVAVKISGLSVTPHAVATFVRPFPGVDGGVTAQRVGARKSFPARLTGGDILRKKAKTGVGVIILQVHLFVQWRSSHGGKCLTSRHVDQVVGGVFLR